MYRFSVSPSSDLTLSDLRIALINFICATQAKKQLIVRIEGHAQEKDQEMLEMLSLFGISYSQLYYQSDNFKYHLQFASTLLDRKKAFICFCPEDNTSSYDGRCENLSSEAILNNPNSFVIRFKKPAYALQLHDVLQGDIGFPPDTIDSFIIMKTNKYPTSVFATACDDMLQGISCVIRSDELLLDAPREELIRSTIGYEQKIEYAHVPMLQQGEASVKSLLDQGFLPEAIVNYLLLGNSTPCEIFILQEALEWFDMTTIATSPTHFEIEKLQAINREHIKRLSDMELSKRLGYACENIGKLAKVYAEEANTTYDIKQKIDAIFAKKEPYAAFEAQSKTLQAILLEAPYFETFDAFEAYLLTQNDLAEDLFYKLLRFWLTGTDHGPEFTRVYPLIKNYLKEIVR